MMVMLSLWTFSSCNQEVIQDHGYGYLSLALDNDMSENVVTKAGEELVYAIDVLNSSGAVVESRTDHRTISSDPIVLPVGKYTVVAKNGENLNAAFDNPYYEGRTEVSIKPSATSTAEITCRLANTKFSVEFSDVFSQFPEYEVSVTNGIGKPLVFSNKPDSGNAVEAVFAATAYFAVTGKLTWTVFVMNSEGGVWSDTVSYTDVTAGQHYHLKFSLGESSAGDGAIELKVTLDKWVDMPEHDVVLDFDKKFGVSTNDSFPAVSGEEVTIAKGDDIEKALTFEASDGIKTLVMTHGSSALSGVGIPQSVELVGASSEMLETLSSAGIIVETDVARALSPRSVRVDVTGLFATLEAGEYEIDFEMTDDNGKKEVFELVAEVVLDVDDAEALRARSGWAAFARLEGRINNAAKKDIVTFQYKKSSASGWTDVAASAVEVDDASMTFSTIVYGLEPSSNYEFRAVSDTDIDTKVVSFTTSNAPTVHNFSFDSWTSSDRSPNASGYSVWDSANSAAGTMITTTKPDSDAVSGKAVRLESLKKFGMFAAGNIFTGKFVKATISGQMGAELDWGTPFTGRPVALRGYYKYSPKTIDNTSDAFSYLDGQTDQCQVLVCLAEIDSPFYLNTAKSQFVDFDNDPGIIAYGQFNTAESSSEYKEFIIPLVYRDNTRIPTYAIIAGASSRYGDYFTGAVGSVLYLDEFEFIYDPAELTDEEYAQVFSRVEPF